MAAIGILRALNKEITQVKCTIILSELAPRNELDLYQTCPN